MYLLIFITAVLVFASVTDIRDHRIPNWLTLSGMVVGLASYFLAGGFRGLLFSAEGLILGFALLIPFYMCGGMGAGDVKLLAAVGALLGPSGVMKAFLCTALVGGAYAIILLAVSRWRDGTVTPYQSESARIDFQAELRGPDTGRYDEKSACPLLRGCYRFRYVPFAAENAYLR